MTTHCRPNSLRVLNELTQTDLSCADRARIQDAVWHHPAGPRTLRHLLEQSPIPLLLKAEIWDQRFPPHQRPAELTDVSEPAALQIFRDVLIEYQALLDLSPRERSATLQDFLIDFNTQVRTALKDAGFSYSEFYDRVLTKDPSLKDYQNDPPRSQVVHVGRYFSLSGIWPLPSYFERTGHTPKQGSITRI